MSQNDSDHSRRVLGNLLRNTTAFRWTGPGGTEMQELQKALKKKKVDARDAGVVRCITKITDEEKERELRRGEKRPPPSLAARVAVCLAVAWLCRAKRELEGVDRQEALQGVGQALEGKDVLGSLKALVKFEGLDLDPVDEQTAVLNVAFCLEFLLGISLDPKKFADMALALWEMPFRGHGALMLGAQRGRCPIRTLFIKLIEDPVRREELASAVLRRRKKKASGVFLALPLRMHLGVGASIDDRRLAFLEVWMIAKGLIFGDIRLLHAAVQYGFFFFLFNGLGRRVKGIIEGGVQRADELEEAVKVVWWGIDFVLKHEKCAVMLAQMVGRVFAIVVCVGGSWMEGASKWANTVASQLFARLVHPEVRSAASAWLEDENAGFLREDLKFWLEVEEGEASQCCSVQCNKELTAKDTQRCSGCKVATYCGPACQAEDWKAFHRDECPAFIKSALSHASFPTSTLLRHAAYYVQCRGAVAADPDESSTTWHLGSLRPILFYGSPEEYPRNNRSAVLLAKGKQTGCCVENVLFLSGAHTYKMLVLLRRKGEKWRAKKWALQAAPVPL